jgi:protein-tyrosine phosphatase
METLLSPGRCPVLIHCQAGKDRTGIICALILLALGADRHLIIDDFMRSNEALLPFFKKTLLRRKILSLGLFPSERILFAVTVRQRNIESILDRIENHYGGINAYLMESGYNTNSLDELKRELLVG